MTSIPTRKIEMKTAQELADAIDNSEETTGFERRCAAMLRTQAAEIESLRKMLVISDDTHQTWMKANAPGGWIDDLRNKCEALEITNDALKADAERFTTLAEYLVSARTECDDVIVAANTVEQLRAAIDAMKGKS